MAVETKNPNTLFLHIPKCGGTSVTRWLNAHTSTFKKVKGKHSKITEHEIDDNTFVFTMIRHPFNRIISGYWWDKWGKKQFKGEFEDWWWSDHSEICRSCQVNWWDDRINYVMKLENQKRDFQKIQLMFEIKADLEHWNKKNHHLKEKRYPTWWHSNTSKKMREDAYKVHKEDFDKLGYELF